VLSTLHCIAATSNKQQQQQQQQAAASAMTEGVFERLANEVLQASEAFVARFEEGLSAMTGGGALHGQAAHKTPPLHAMEHDGEFAEDDLLRNPLHGIAQEVMGDILSSQVRLARCRSSRFWSITAHNHCSQSPLPSPFTGQTRHALGAHSGL
jgi:hypothetical protein